MWLGLDSSTFGLGLELVGPAGVGVRGRGAAPAPGEAPHGNFRPFFRGGDIPPGGYISLLHSPLPRMQPVKPLHLHPDLVQPLPRSLSLSQQLENHHQEKLHVLLAILLVAPSLLA